MISSFIVKRRRQLSMTGIVQLLVKKGNTISFPIEFFIQKVKVRINESKYDRKILSLLKTKTFCFEIDFSLSEIVSFDKECRKYFNIMKFQILVILYLNIPPFEV